MISPRHVGGRASRLARVAGRSNLWAPLMGVILAESFFACSPALRLERVDEHLFRFFYDARAGALTSIAAAFSVAGQGWILLALLPLLAFRRHRATALALTGVLAATAVAVSLLKLAVHRVRPCHALTGVRCLWGTTPTDFSFPSGHAAGSFAFAAFVGSLALAGASGARPRRRWRLATCAIAIGAATCIALSRVYLGVHFPGDVAAGSLLGAAIGTLGARFHVRSGPRVESGAPSRRSTSRSPETHT
jgi:undecaprenyl-diphosphatase